MRHLASLPLVVGVVFVVLLCAIGGFPSFLFLLSCYLSRCFPASSSLIASDLSLAPSWYFSLFAAPFPCSFLHSSLLVAGCIFGYFNRDKSASVKLNGEVYGKRSVCNLQFPIFNQHYQLAINFFLESKLNYHQLQCNKPERVHVHCCEI